jgi:hypothetical protein
MLRTMAGIAKECARRPRGYSVWSASHGRYLCDKDSEFKERSSPEVPSPDARHPSISSLFKLVFWTSVLGTAFFFVVCVLIHLATSGIMPPATQKLADGALSMAQVGFGAIVGLLGGLGAQAER